VSQAKFCRREKWISNPPPACGTTRLFIGSFGTEFHALGAGSPQDRTALLAILDDEGAAWAKGDADAFAAHARNNVVFTNIVGMFSVG
jgi:hypothetical protein